MNRISILIGSALALATVSPARAEKSDRIIVENMRARINVVRSELGTNSAGTVELSEADARLRDLFTALDNNEAADARASINGIEALLAAARVRANAGGRTPAASPALWRPAPIAAPIRKRISYRTPVRPKNTGRIASR
jgi:hypothetical protein